MEYDVVIIPQVSETKSRFANSEIAMAFLERHIRPSIHINSSGQGFTIIELLVAILSLGIAGAMAIQLSNSTNRAMLQMDQRSRVDSAIAARMEAIRDISFRHLCTNGCENDELTQELQYDTTTLEDLCNNNTLGNSLLTALSQAEGDLTTNFNTNDYDQTSASLPITAQFTANDNELQITFSESNTNVQITSTVVPHAHGWCP